MSKVNVFQDSTKTLPRSDARVVRIDFDKEDIGARKSHIAGIAPKNSNTIKHV